MNGHENDRWIIHGDNDSDNHDFSNTGVGVRVFENQNKRGCITQE
jgi:hypothetical protein